MRLCVLYGDCSDFFVITIIFLNQFTHSIYKIMAYHDDNHIFWISSFYLYSSQYYFQLHETASFE